MSSEEQNIKMKRICSSCIGDSYLRKVIEYNERKPECSYCHEPGSTIEIEALAHRVDQALRVHYYHTKRMKNMVEWESIEEGDSFIRDGEPICELIARELGLSSCSETAAEDIRKILEAENLSNHSCAPREERPYSKGALYQRMDYSGNEHSFVWESVKHEFKTRTRYLNTGLMEQLDMVFAKLESFRTSSDRPVVIDAGPDWDLSAFFRARVFFNDPSFWRALETPDVELGPPPSRLKTEGRMNAKGVSVFYGTLDLDTAIAEVRPPVGSRVIVGRFELKKRLRILDLSALREIKFEGSIFNNEHYTELELAAFLAKLSHEMCLPVLPEKQDVEYPLTQAIAEYLSDKIGLDGMIYPSVQSNSGLNVVLFHDSSRVELLRTLWIDNIDSKAFNTEDTREVNLRLDRTSLQIHRIRDARLFDPEPEALPNIEVFAKESILLKMPPSKLSAYAKAWRVSGDSCSFEDWVMGILDKELEKVASTFHKPNPHKREL